jgi:hypothetical protein
MPQQSNWKGLPSECTNKVTRTSRCGTLSPCPQSHPQSVLAYIFIHREIIFASERGSICRLVTNHSNRTLLRSLSQLGFKKPQITKI